MNCGEWRSTLGLLCAGGVLAGTLYFWTNFAPGPVAAGLEYPFSATGDFAQLAPQFSARYAGLSLSQLVLQLEQHTADYQAMIDMMVESMFMNGICKEIVLSDDGGGYVSRLPRPFVFTRTEKKEGIAILRVVELDQENYPEVWMSFAEGTWLNEAVHRQRLQAATGHKQ